MYTSPELKTPSKLLTLFSLSLSLSFSVYKPTFQLFDNNIILY